jgi:hypothetical protein
MRIRYPASPGLRHHGSAKDLRAGESGPDGGFLAFFLIPLAFFIVLD